MNNKPVVSIRLGPKFGQLATSWMDSFCFREMGFWWKCNLQFARQHSDVSRTTTQQVQVCKLRLSTAGCDRNRSPRSENGVRILQPHRTRSHDHTAERRYLHHKFHPMPNAEKVSIRAEPLAHPSHNLMWFSFALFGV